MDGKNLRCKGKQNFSFVSITPLLRVRELLHQEMFCSKWRYFILKGTRNPHSTSCLRYCKPLAVCDHRSLYLFFCRFFSYVLSFFFYCISFIDIVVSTIHEFCLKMVIQGHSLKVAISCLCAEFVYIVIFTTSNQSCTLKMWQLFDDP